MYILGNDRIFCSNYEQVLSDIEFLTGRQALWQKVIEYTEFPYILIFVDALVARSLKIKIRRPRTRKISRTIVNGRALVCYSVFMKSVQ